MMALPIIGIVIPCFGHSQYLAEAIISACEQQMEASLRVVVVDDGCRFEETALVVESLKARYEGLLFYIRQENTRLPGARNSGVRFLLGMEPEIESIFFLDADNRLSPHSLSVFRQALGDDAKVGWAYPDINMFGYTQSDAGFDIKETAPDYSPLTHLMGNISEAGSLVRADVFRSGVFYDEDMKHGFEDWDFWLSALEAGYTGVRAPYSGFMYRRRPESMLADSRRLEDTLIGGIRRKHASLFKPANLMQMEQAEAPVFAIYIIGADSILLTSDPKREPKEEPLSVFCEKVSLWLQDDRLHFMPDFLLVLSAAQWENMQERRLSVRWLWWMLKDQRTPATYVYSKYAHKSAGIKQLQAHEALPEGFASPWLLSLSMEGLQILLSARGTSKVQLQEIEKTCHYDFTRMRAFDYAPDDNEGALQQAAEHLLNHIDCSDKYVRHRNRRYSGPARSGLQPVLMEPVCAEEGKAPFPVVAERRRVTVLLDPKIFVGLNERQAFASFMHRFKNISFETAIILEQMAGENFTALPIDILGAVDDVVPVFKSQPSLGHRKYAGRRYSVHLEPRTIAEISVLCRTSDLIVSYGVAGGLEAFGQAKTGYSQTVVWLEGVPEERDDNSKLLAYEHAVSCVVCEDITRMDFLVASGFPRGKFMSRQQFRQLVSVGT